MAKYQDIIILAIGRAFQILAGFLTIKLATSFLSPDQMGSMNQIMSLAVLGTSACLIPFSSYIARGFLEWRDAGVLHDYLWEYVRAVVTGGVIFGLLAWWLQRQNQVVWGAPAVWVGGLVLLYTVGYSLHIMGTSGLNLTEHRLLYVLFGNVAVWGGLVMAMAFTRMAIEPEVWLLGIYCGFVLSSLSTLLLFRYSSAGRPQGLKTERSSLSFSRQAVLAFIGPQAMVFVLWWIQSQSYRFVLPYIADIRTVGLFAAGYMICSVPMQTFETLFNEFYSPTFFRALRGQHTGGLAQAWNHYAAAYIPSVILFGAFLAGSVTFLVRLLLGEQFQAIAPVMVLPALTETFRAMSSSLHQLGLAKVDMSVTLWPVLAGAIVAPTLVYLFAPYDPLLGTAAALCGAAVTVFLICIPIAYRTLPVVWPIRRVMGAVALGVPVALFGNLAAIGLGELSYSKALIALTCSALLMLCTQYVMSKKWLRALHQGAETGT